MPLKRKSDCVRTEISRTAFGNRMLWMNKMYRLLIFTLILLLASAHAALSADKKSTLFADLTYDGSDERIEVHVVEVMVEKIINWGISVYDNDDLIYNFELKLGTQACFDDPECVGGCVDYLSCRDKWFEELLIGRHIHTVENEEARHDSMLELFRRHASKDYAKRFNLTEEDAQKSVDRLANSLTGNNIVCLVLPGPIVTWGPLMTYDKFQKRFVHFYSP
ncbi:MAG: hypothetical protein DRH08_08445 [Deltaproteobacteria bacterium]|nr:MAG: hypothetical protein DRH08_08445 [Deltaproteobacteria bacterium]